MPSAGVTRTVCYSQAAVDLLLSRPCRCLHCLHSHAALQTAHDSANTSAHKGVASASDWRVDSQMSFCNYSKMMLFRCLAVALDCYFGKKQSFEN